MDYEERLRLLSIMSIGYVALSLTAMHVLQKENRKILASNHELYRFSKIMLNKAAEEAPHILRDPEVNDFLIDWEFRNIAENLKGEM